MFNKKQNISNNSIQVEELKLRKMKISRIEDFDTFFDECVKLINDSEYEKKYRLMSLSYLLKDSMPAFMQKLKEPKKTISEQDTLIQ